MVGRSVLLVVHGAGWYWLGWTASVRVPNRNDAGEWPSAPAAIVAVLRRGPGPPLIPAMALEVVGIVWISIGQLGLAGVRSNLGSSFMLGSVILPGMSWLLVELRGRWRD